MSQGSCSSSRPQLHHVGDGSCWLNHPCSRRHNRHSPHVQLSMHVRFSPAPAIPTRCLSLTATRSVHLHYIDCHVVPSAEHWYLLPMSNNSICPGMPSSAQGAGGRVRSSPAANSPRRLLPRPRRPSQASSVPEARRWPRVRFRNPAFFLVLFFAVLKNGAAAQELIIRSARMGS